MYLVEGGAMARVPARAENRLLRDCMTDNEPAAQEGIARLTAPNGLLDDWPAYRAAGQAATDTVRRLAE